MKTLFVMRHAKSSWTEPALKDFARPLAQRGIDDISNMAARFMDRGCALEAIVSSPAVRTATTAALFASAIGLSTDRVSINAELYFAGAPMLLSAASLFDDTCAAVMLVGHNPAVTDFVNELVGLNSGIAIDTVPTSGLLQFELDIESWAHIALGNTRLIEFDYPKKESKC